MQRFQFTQPVELSPGEYGVIIKYVPKGPSMRITAWSVADPSIKYALYVNGKERAGTLDYALDIAAVDKPFRRVLTAGGISVYENLASPDGPYFLADLEQRPDASSGSGVHVQSYRAGAFVLKYDGSKPGFVVVPMKWVSGWDVHVGDTMVRPKLMLGVLPAVPVSGPSVISFEFRPLILRWRVLLAWLAVLGLALFTVRAVGTCLERATR